MTAIPGNGTYSSGGEATLPNDIPTITHYIKEVLDEVFVAEAKTVGMTPDPAVLRASSQAGIFKLATIKTTGLGTYDTRLGYPTGQIATEWNEYRVEVQRGIRYVCDPAESIMGGGLVTAMNAMATATRQEFVPEVDAYRFSKIHGTINGNNAIKSTHVKSQASLANSDILGSVIDGLDVVSDSTGLDTGLTIYMNQALRNTIHKSTEYTKTKDIAGGNSFSSDITEINGNRIVWVPKQRMMTAITLKDGYTNAYSDTTTTPETVDYNQFGYAPASGAKYLNFVITAPNTCMGIMALNNPKIILAADSEKYDADQAMIRMWHDLIIPVNKQPGVYISVGGTVS